MRKTWICKTVNDTPFGSVVKFASNSKEYYIYGAQRTLFKIQYNGSRLFDESDVYDRLIAGEYDQWWVLGGKSLLIILITALRKTDGAL